MKKSRSSLIGDLIRRGNQRLISNPDEITEFHAALTNELKGASDRTIAIVWATAVEDALRWALITQMIGMTETEASSLFDGGGPLANFMGKIRVGWAFDLFPTEHKHELAYIREIRNFFAHTQPGASFEDPAVKAICQTFEAPRKIWGMDPDRSRASDQYGATCDFYWCYFRNFRVGYKGSPGPQLAPASL